MGSSIALEIDYWVCNLLFNAISLVLQGCCVAQGQQGGSTIICDSQWEVFRGWGQGGSRFLNAVLICEHHGNPWAERAPEGLAQS